MFRALAEAGVWDVSAPVQPSGWRPTAVSLSLLLCSAAMQPRTGSVLLQLALQLSPPFGLVGPHGVLAAMIF